MYIVIHILLDQDCNDVVDAGEAMINVDRIIGPEEPAAPRFGVTSCSENMSIKGSGFLGSFI